MLNDLENLYGAHQLRCHVSAGAAVSKIWMETVQEVASSVLEMPVSVTERKKKKPPLNLHTLLRPELKLVWSDWHRAAHTTIYIYTDTAWGSCREVVRAVTLLKLAKKKSPVPKLNSLTFSQSPW